MNPDIYSSIELYPNPNYSFLKWKYDVFLSFTGKDTRLNFTDHIYDAFTRNAIRCFKDDVDLKRGEDIKEDLFQAIHDSMCAVLIISENYANSGWCLEELREILESRKKVGLKVFPVFYDVDPSDVRHQKGSFGKALAKHEMRFQQSEDKDNNKASEWREALSQVSKLSGWDTRNRPETEVVREIVQTIWNTKFTNLPSFDDNLVGIESRMVELNSLLEIDADDVRFVGIWGMRGVGKTNLARLVFEEISGHFEYTCFISNVTENSKRKGLASLQKDILPRFIVSELEDDIDQYSFNSYMSKLCHNAKVLLVLDDVSNLSQLESLASPEWFGAGCRIIITTTNSHLLVSHGVHDIFKVEPMGKDDSLKLFCRKAFKKDCPEDDYSVLSETVVRYTGGLPLALITLGSFLCGRSLFEWEETLERMTQIPDDDIFQVLKISYNGLNNEEKTIFLDIACLFNGWRRDEITQILKNCGLHPTIGINVLIERALLIEKKELDGEYVLEVHDLLRELAKIIVYQESTGHVERRSRLWDIEDINEVLQNEKGSEAIQAIVLPFNLDGKIEVHHEAFAKMDNLRLLIISSELKLPNGLKCFSSALQVIQWRSYPLETLPFGTDRLDKLVEIQMPFSKIRHWNGIKLMKKMKFIDLSNSQHMVETPDFSTTPNLEKLNLEGCSSLIKVHDSLGELKRLVELNLSNCISLQTLPEKLEMESLLDLDISRCKKLSKLPEFGECMKQLSSLNAQKTAITKLPKSLKFLIGLKELNLKKTQMLVLEMSIFNLKTLTILDLSACGLSDESIPEDLGGLSSLISLYLEANSFDNLPSGCFSNLLQLGYLYLNGCGMLKSLPKLPPRLARLYAENCKSLKSLSSDGMWSLVSSLDHEYRCQTNYDKRVSQPIQSGYVPGADFLLIMPESIIPSWFPNRFSVSITHFNYDSTSEYEFEVEIPTHFRASKWCGLVVCLTIEDKGMGFDKLVISWSCKSHEDYYSCIEWENEIFVGYEWEDSSCLMLLDFNEETCWKYLRENNNRLHIKLTARYKYSSRLLSMECGWRILCQEDIQEWSNNKLIDEEEEDEENKDKEEEDNEEEKEEEHNSFHELSPQGQNDSCIKDIQEWGNKLFEEEHNSNLLLSPQREGSSHDNEMQNRGNMLAKTEHNIYHEQSPPKQGSSLKEEMQERGNELTEELPTKEGGSHEEEIQEWGTKLIQEEHNIYHERSHLKQDNSLKEEIQERGNELAKEKQNSFCNEPPPPGQSTFHGDRTLGVRNVISRNNHDSSRRQEHGHPKRYFGFLVLISVIFIFKVKVQKYL